jgi:hypothetical protein
MRDRITHADGRCRTPPCNRTDLPRTPSGRPRKPGAPAAADRTDTPCHASESPPSGSAVLGRVGQGLAGVAHGPDGRATRHRRNEGIVNGSAAVGRGAQRERVSAARAWMRLCGRSWTRWARRTHGGEPLGSMVNGANWASRCRSGLSRGQPSLRITWRLWSRWTLSLCRPSPVAYGSCSCDSPTTAAGSFHLRSRNIPRPRARRHQSLKPSGRHGAGVAVEGPGRDVWRGLQPPCRW